MLLALMVIPAQADMYLNNPRGSNNKLREQSNNVQNANRLFDSQNNAASGYQIGDDCKPACKDENNNYDVTKEGATKGTMKFYQGSELYIEWHHQHGCGVGHPNLRCQIILQYMSESDNSNLRDGTGQDSAGGDENDDPTEEDTADPARGYHEPLDFYEACIQRQRNQGLYTADQNLESNGGATSTRQNPNGNGRRRGQARHGLECPEETCAICHAEERDYYPYWHPSVWHDIAILTDEPETRCAYYQMESQNVKGKHRCSIPAHNNREACISDEGEWEEVEPFNEPPPECFGSIQSRDNHNGNVRNGQPDYYLWKIPPHLKGRTVIRIRYNITTGDFQYGSLANPKEKDAQLSGEKADAFFMDKRFNDPNPGNRRRSIFKGRPEVPLPLAQDPVADWVELGEERLLQLQVNTNQFGRTFEDRTHTFIVMERPADVQPGQRIVNYNVRGRRGNIVQVYPSVEYDFVPSELAVEQGTLLHFQWTGSDANPNGNAGNGRAGTDRSNLVQLENREETVPLPMDRHTLFFNARANPNDEEGKRLVTKFAYLDQDSLVECDPETNDQNSETNCKQLNGASAYFDGGLVEMKTPGKHYVASTRNNDFSNRSHKAVIIVSGVLLEIHENWIIGLGIALGLPILVYLFAALWACCHPGSWLFSSRYRPRILGCLVRKEKMLILIERRRQIKSQQRKAWLKKAGAYVDEEGAGDQATDMALPDENVSWFQSFNRGCRRCGFGEQRQTTLMYGLLNVIVFAIGFVSNLNGGFKGSWAYPVAKGGGYSMDLKGLKTSNGGSRRCGFGEQRQTTLMYGLLNVIVFAIGFVSNLNGGFKGSWAYPVAKGGGYSMDLNFAMLVLPTLKSLQTAGRRMHSSREWIPTDDPINFHMVIAGFTFLGAFIHIAAHCVHAYKIHIAPVMQSDPLQLWKLTPEETTSGMPIWLQALNLRNRCAILSGVILTIMMLAILLTAMSCVRRGTNCLTRRMGGFNLFWRVHMSWKFIYILLLLHAPARLWIWFFFPAIFVLVDRMLLSSHQELYLSLRHVKLLPRDVIGLTFEIPQGFVYQAGQYILLGWKGEWHPFTLTSAPEENCISVHIRSPNSLDWCSALRKRLTQEAPAQAQGIDPAESKPPKAPVLIEYNKCVISSSSPVIYNTPRVARSTKGEEAREDQGPRLLGRSNSGKQVEPVQSGETMISRVEPGMLPSEAVVLQVTGPFGAPAQKVWGFETLMVVGAGIGVTPFASILRSVQMKSKQRETIMNSSRPSTWKSSMGGDDTRASLQRLIEDLVVVPKKIYFYWICRGQEEFDWFSNLLSDAADGPAAGIVDITLFLTGEIELSQVKKLPCATGQFFGRPNWGRIFKTNREKHKGEHIGVFLCGSPIIGEALSRESIKNSDLVGTPGGTRFSFFKEHF
eukprot:Skav231794  [mRNA]  locus=scaffold734:99355:104163:+ [translate_table: standard]